jgi:hypothetical protein
VERGVAYVQENALRGHEFETLAAQNEHLAQWERTVADTRIHGTTFKQVRSDFESDERPALAKLPLERFAFDHEANRKVSRDGHIAVNKSFKALWWETGGLTLWYRRLEHGTVELPTAQGDQPHITDRLGRVGQVDRRRAAAVGEDQT